MYVCRSKTCVSWGREAEVKPQPLPPKKNIISCPETPLDLRETTNVLWARVKLRRILLLLFVSCRFYASAQSILNYLFRLIQRICWDPLPTRDVLRSLLDQNIYWILCWPRNYFLDRWPIHDIYYDPLLIQNDTKHQVGPLSRNISLSPWARTLITAKNLLFRNCKFNLANCTIIQLYSSQSGSQICPKGSNA